jgi:hypothetical protein
MSEQLYSLVLRLYPRAFRERYADEMIRVFSERVRDEGVARVWLDVLADAAVSIPVQHFQSPRPHPMFPPSAAPLRWNVHAFLAMTLIVSFLTGATLAASFFRLSPWVVALVMGVGLVVCTRGIRTARAVKAYRVEIDGDSLTVACEAIGISPLTLRRSDVTGVHIWEKIGLRVQTADPSHDLWVPASAPAYGDVRAHLSQWAPVTTTPFAVAFRGNMRVPQLMVVCALTAFLPIAFARGMGLVFAVYVVMALVKRDVPPFKLALMAVPVLIVLVRWFW